jgi:predicted dehydrogenase
MLPNSSIMNAPNLNRREFLSLTSAAVAASAINPSAAFAAPAVAPLKPFALGLLIVPSGAAEDKFRVLRDLGLNNCFLQLDAYINGYTPAVVSQFRDLIAKYEITVTTVEVVRPEPLKWNFLEGPSTIGLIPPKYRAARIDALRQVSDFAKQLGIPGPDPLRLHSRRSRRPALSASRRSHPGLSPHCHGNGQYFLMETGQETPTTMSRMIRDVNMPNLGRRPRHREPHPLRQGQPVDAVDILGPHVRSIHAKDGRWPTDPSNLGEEVLIGKGLVNFREVFTKLHRLGYTGAVTIERETSGPQQIEDVRAEKIYLERILAKCLPLSSPICFHISKSEISRTQIASTQEMRSMNRRNFSASRRRRLRPAPSQAQHRIRLPGQLRRASWAAWLRLARHSRRDVVSQNTTAQVVALADLFPDNLAWPQPLQRGQRQALGHEPIEQQAALSRPPHAFEQLAASPDVDLIQISTPPFFHVEHLEAAVASGKHVYCEKPIGIDVAQARQALEIAKRVKPTQSVEVGFQCRNAPPIAAIAERIQAGALGKIASVRPTTTPPPRRRKLRAGASPTSYRLRNWLWFTALSGDILVEQNIHIIDLCNWILGAHPLKATPPGAATFSPTPATAGTTTRWTSSTRRTCISPSPPHSLATYGGFDAGLKFYGSRWHRPPRLTPAQCIFSARRPGSGKIPPPQPRLGTFAANGSLLRQSRIRRPRQGAQLHREHHLRQMSHNEIAAGVETALSCMLGRMAGYQKREVGKS